VFKLSLNENELEELIVENHPALKSIEARKNKLVDKISFFASNSLSEIYLAENQINSMNFMKHTTSAIKIHLRNNKIERLSNEND
jgi:Leucine-rich repeat (LRR) protein